jgi:hypothetical protein
MTCVVALALALVVAAPASARRAGPAIGIGEQHSEMFSSKLWKRLDMPDARYLAPWDTLQDPGQLALLDRWMASARRAHARILIGFGHSLRSAQLARHLPSQREFERQFKGFRKRYPWVRDWIVWNEANNPLGMTARRPGRVAQYFDAAMRNCRGCRIVGADLLDTRNMASWAAGFRRAAHHKPRIWGLHNYGDANRMTVKNTRKLLAVTRGQIWFTETGGVVLRRVYQGRRVVHTYRYGASHAGKSTSHVFKLACLSRRITRVYLYDWQPPSIVTSWDSGLLDGRGRPRAAYNVLRRWLTRSAHHGRSTLCR